MVGCEAKIPVRSTETIASIDLLTQWDDDLRPIVIDITVLPEHEIYDCNPAACKAFAAHDED